MTAIERTAYPRFRSSLTQEELDTYYTLTEPERAFVQARASGETQRLTLALLLKGFQKLGYLPRLRDVPDQIGQHIAHQLQISLPYKLKNTAKATRKRYRRAIYDRLQVKPYERGGAEVVEAIVQQSARTMSDPADLINVAVEELLRQRFALPAYSTLDEFVHHIRHEPQLTYPPIESFLKRYKNERRRKKMEPIYRKMLAEAEALSVPKAIYAEFSLAEVSNLSEWLPAETTAVVLGLCTLGLGLQERIQELSQNDLALGVVLDEIALAVIVAITRDLHRSIRSEAQTRGLKAGPAYRPGVGRWPIETQRTVFACLPAAKIGVSLSQELFMIPIQSTSLIIPLLDRNS